MSEQDDGGLFTNAFGRGVDQTQMMGYGFANAIGDFFGVDSLERWSRKGIEQNLDDLRRNPPKLESWDDIDSLSDFGTYFIEALGEGAPTLLSVIGTGGAGGAAAIGARALGNKAAAATLGKYMKRELGKDAIKEFAKANAKAKAKGQVFGAAAGSYVLNTGETQVGFEQRGLDNPGTAFITGGVKAALDMVGLAGIRQAARATGKPVEGWIDMLSNLGSTFGKGAGKEALTEAMQTVVDMGATNLIDPTYELSDYENLKEIGDAFLKGGIVGGSFGAAMTVPAQLYEKSLYDKSRKASDQQMEKDAFSSEEEQGPIKDADDLANQYPDPEPYESENSEPSAEEFDTAVEDIESATQPTPRTPPLDAGDVVPLPEGEADMQAQATALENPQSTKKAMLVVPGSFDPYENGRPPPLDVERIAMSNGDVVYTNDEATAEKVLSNEPSDQLYGDILYNNPQGKPQDASLVVTATDPDTNGVAFEMATNEEGLGATLEEARFQAGSNLNVNVIQAEDGVSAAMQSIATRISKLVDTKANGQDEVSAPAIAQFISTLANDASTADDVNTVGRQQLSAITEGLKKDPVNTANQINQFVFEQNAVEPEPTPTRPMEEALTNLTKRKKGKQLLNTRLTEALTANTEMTEEEIAAVVNADIPQQAAFLEQFDNADIAEAILGDTPQNAAELRDASIEQLGPDIKNDTFDSTVERIIASEEGLEFNARGSNHINKVDLSYGSKAETPQDQASFENATFNNVVIAYKELQDYLKDDNPIVSPPVRAGSEGILEFAPASVVTNKLVIENRKTPQTNITRGVPYTTPDLLSHDVAKKAVKDGKLRMGLTNNKNPAIQQRARASLVYATPPKAKKPVPLSVTALTDGGIDMLVGERQESQQATNTNKGEGYLRMVGELETRGWKFNKNKEGETEATLPNQVIYHGNIVKNDPVLTLRKSRTTLWAAQKKSETEVREERALEAMETLDALTELANQGGYNKTIVPRKVRNNQEPQAVPTEPFLIERYNDATRKMEEAKIKQINAERSKEFKPKMAFTPNVETRLWGKARTEIEKRRKTGQEQRPEVEFATNGSDVLDRQLKETRKAEDKERQDTFYVETNTGTATIDPKAPAERKLTWQQNPKLSPEATESLAQLDKFLDEERTVSLESRTGKGKSRVGQVQGIGESVTQDDVDYVSYVFNQAGLDTGEATSFSETKITVMSLEAIDSMAGPTLVPWRRFIKQHFADNPNTRATTFGTGKRRIIIIRPSTPTSANDTKASIEERAANRKYILAHEAGHVLLDSARENLTPQQKIYLTGLWKKESSENPQPAWTGKTGYAEWFADKTAARARKKVNQRKPKNLADHIFNKVVKKLQKMFNAVKGRVPKRFANNDAFNRFMDGLKPGVFDIELAVSLSTQGLSDINIGDPQQRIRDVISQDTLRYAAKKLKKGIKAFTNTRVGRLVMTRDAVLTEIHEPTARAIYANTDGIYRNGDGIRHENGVTYVNGGRSWRSGFERDRNSWLARAEGITRDVPEADLTKAYYELATETPTAELKTEVAKQYRALMEDLWETVIKVHMPYMKNQKVENFWHRVFDKVNVANDVAGFESILSQFKIKNPQIVTEHLLKPQNDVNDNSATTLVRGWQRNRVLKDPVLIKALVDAKFLNTDPTGDFQKYLEDVMSRTNFERVFGGIDKNGKWNSKLHLQTALQDIPKEKHADFVNMVNSSIWPNGLDPNNNWHNFLGEVQAFESLRVLMFSGVASTAEVAGVYSALKGVLSGSEFRGILRDTIQTPQELKQFAEDAGYLAGAASGAMIQDLEKDAMVGRGYGPRRILPYLFKYNGNDFVTRYTRVIAAQAGRLFIKKLAARTLTGKAAENTQRYLDELGLTAQDIKLWVKLGEPSQPWAYKGAERVAVEKALFGIDTFISKSVLRPNASEKTIWAEEPLGRMVFHLKSFSYTFNKRILGGVVREVNAKLENGENVNSAIPTLIGMLYVFLLFGALSDELRQRIKSFGTKGSLDQARGSYSQAVENWGTRAGLFSLPFTDVITNPSAESVAYSLGPTSHHLYELLFENYGDRTVALKALKSTPGINQLPELRKAILEELD